MEKQTEELELEISSEPLPALVLDPNFAALYRRKVERWPANLDTTDSRTEAAGIPRSLVETIRVRNLYIGIEIEFVGKITNIIKAAQTANQRGKPAS